MPSVPATMVGVSELGRMRRNSSPVDDSPRAREAVTKSCSRTLSTEARMMRAKMGTATMAMASCALMMPLPSTVTMAMASSSAGKTSSTSIVRMMMLSDLPEVKPATAPSREPTTMAMPTVTKPTTSDTRAP